MRRLGCGGSFLWRGGRGGSTFRTVVTSRKPRQKRDAVAVEKQVACAVEKPVFEEVHGHGTHCNGVFRFDLPAAASVHALPRGRKSLHSGGLRPDAHRSRNTRNVSYPWSRRREGAAGGERVAPRQGHRETPVSNDFSVKRPTARNLNDTDEVTKRGNDVSLPSRMTNIRVIRLV